MTNYESLLRTIKELKKKVKDMQDNSLEDAFANFETDEIIEHIEYNVGNMRVIKCPTLKAEMEFDEFYGEYKKRYLIKP